MSYRQRRALRKARFRSFLGVLLLIFLSAAVALGLYKAGMAALGLYQQMVMQVQVVEMGVLENRHSSSAIVLREETVVYAPQRGHLENLVREQQKVRMQTPIGYFVGSELNRIHLKSPAAGIFTTAVDGREGRLHNISIEEVDLAWFEPGERTDSPAAGSQREAGEGLYKIINNLTPLRLLLFLPLDAMHQDPQDTRSLRIYYQGDFLGNGRVQGFKIEGDRAIFLVNLDYFTEILLNKRYIDIEVSDNTTRGFIVPREALVEQDGATGIYYLREERVHFRHVEVLAIQDEYAAVSGLNANEIVITNPEIVP